MKSKRNHWKYEIEVKSFITKITGKKMNDFEKLVAQFLGNPLGIVLCLGLLWFFVIQPMIETQKKDTDNNKESSDE